MGDDLETGAVTQLIRASAAGDVDARDQVIRVVYRDLQRLAHNLMARERPGHTLQATALVNEVMLKFLSHENGFCAENRSELMALTANSMRRLLVDHARTRTRGKRGGGAELLPIQPELDGAMGSDETLLMIHDALDRLKVHSARAAEVAQLKIFGGFTVEEIAEALGVNSRTVNRDWLFARAWLHKQLY